MKKKVIELTGYIVDGGAESVVRDYCLKLNKELFEVELVVISDNRISANSHILRRNNINIIELLPGKTVFHRVVYHFFSKILIQIKLFYLMKQEKPDVVHVHLALLSHVAKIRKELKNTKIVYTCHSKPQNFFCGKRKKEGNAARKLFAENDFRIIGLHDKMTNEINEMFGVNNSLTVYNGIQLNKYLDVKENRLVVRKKEGIPEDAIVIGHVGRFNEVKNHAFLLDIFDALYKDNESFFLLLIGDGELREKIEQTIKEKNLVDNVLILSNRSDVNELMGAMDVFVFPSLYEGYGLVALEAQASGIRCVLSDSIPSDVVVSDAVIQVSLLAGVETWCRAIYQQIQNEDRKIKYIEKIEQYDINNVVNKIQNLYLQ